MKRNKSPCIEICEFTEQNGWCIGCGRTKPECREWKKMKPYARRILEKELQRRMEKMAENGQTPK